MAPHCLHYLMFIVSPFMSHSGEFLSLCRMENGTKVGKLQSQLFILQPSTLVLVFQIHTLTYKLKNIYMAFHYLQVFSKFKYTHPHKLHPLSTFNHFLMTSALRSSFMLSNLTENWPLLATSTFICVFAGYVVYNTVMATVSELLQRLLVVSPLLLVIVVHWLSAGSHVNIGIPGSEPGAIHRAGGSPYGVALVLVLLFFLISCQPSFLGLIV